jgi:hypothetical protein
MRRLEPPARAASIVPPAPSAAPSRPRASWRPEVRPCLRCNQPRISTGPGDRLHDKCRSEGPNDGEAAGLVLP